MCRCEIQKLKSWLGVDWEHHLGIAMDVSFILKKCFIYILISSKYLNLPSAVANNAVYVSPFADGESRSVPPYMIDLYQKIANPRRKICHDRTFVSFENKVKTSSSICSSGEIMFDLHREEENGRFLYSARTYIEVQSALNEEQEPRRVIVALSFKNNDTLLGYTELETSKYGSVDITEEARKWWAQNELITPQMNVHFYITYPKNLRKSCEDIFWRSSILVVWQNKPKCRKKLRVPRHNIFPEEYEEDFEEEENFSTLRELKNSLQESPTIDEQPLARRRRSLSGISSLTSLKNLFLNVSSYEPRSLFDPDRSSDKDLMTHLLTSSKEMWFTPHTKSFLDVDVAPNSVSNYSAPVQFRRTKAKRHSRHGRKKNAKGCRLRKNTVIFKELNWDWVIAPREYESGKCSGQCTFPLLAEWNPTGLAILKNVQRHVRGKGRNPSCVPDKMLSITLLFLDSQNDLVVKEFQDMIVKSCVCR